MSQKKTAGSTIRPGYKSPSVFKQLGRNIKAHPYLYLLFLPVFVYYVIFHYWPMYGVIIAFKDFKPMKGIFGSEWVGLLQFKTFLSSTFLWRLIRNTLSINLGMLLVGFPIPILFALLLNEITCSWYKKFVQTASYMPHFISSVIVVGMVFTFVNGEGIVNDFLALFGVQRSSLLVEPKAFPAIFVTTSVWKSFGWGSILYLSNITSIDPGLYESARLDGANRGQRMWYITLPHLKNLILIQLIFSVGGLLSSSTDLILLLYNPAIYSTSDVIGTYVYRLGIEGGKFSQTAAIGLFATIINFILVFIANQLSNKISGTGLW